MSTFPAEESTMKKARPSGYWAMQKRKQRNDKAKYAAELKPKRERERELAKGSTDLSRKQRMEKSERNKKHY